MIRSLLSVLTDTDRRRAWRLIGYIVALSLTQAGAYLAIIPLLEAFLGEDLQTAWRWVILLGCLTAMIALLGYLQASLGIQVGMSAQTSIQHRAGDHIGALPLGWFGPQKVGPVARSLTTGTDEIFGAFGHYLLPLISGILVPAGVAIGMLFINPPVGLAMLISAPILYLVNKWGIHLYARTEAQDTRASSAANNAVIEYTQAQAVLRSTGSTSRGNNTLTTALEQQRKTGRRLVLQSLPGQIGFSLIVQLTFILLVYVVIARTFSAELSAPAAIALIAVTARFTDPLNTAAVMATALRGSVAAAERVTALLSEPLMPVPTTDHEPQGTTIAFDHVRFSYSPERQVIDDVSFTVPAGTTTALVGASGAGKTTLLRLAARFYDTTSGSVCIGGNDVCDYATETLTTLISMVFQNVYLFDTTIAENIRIGKPSATDEEIRVASENAGINEIITRLPLGLDTPVGEGGRNLSGGERQRIAIARALLKDAPIVLLDEATSSLDAANEALVLEGIRRLTQGKTVLVVAHRLTTIRDANQIIFLRDGHIAEQGTHEQLQALGGHYAAFWRDRDRASGWHITKTKHQ